MGAVEDEYEDEDELQDSNYNGTNEERDEEIVYIDDGTPENDIVADDTGENDDQGDDYDDNETDDDPTLDDIDDPVISLDNDDDDLDDYMEIEGSGVIPEGEQVTILGKVRFREQLGTGSFGKSINLAKDHQNQSSLSKAPWLLTSAGIIFGLLCLGIVVFLAFRRRYQKLKASIYEKRQQTIASQRARMAQLNHEKESGRLLDAEALLEDDALSDSQSFIPRVSITQASPDFGECFPNPSMTHSRQDRFNV